MPRTNNGVAREGQFRLLFYVLVFRGRVSFPPGQWVRGACRRIADRTSKFSALTGRNCTSVSLAPGLDTHWFQPSHHMWDATTDTEILSVDHAKTDARMCVLAQIVKCCCTGFVLGHKEMSFIIPFMPSWQITHQLFPDSRSGTLQC